VIPLPGGIRTPVMKRASVDGLELAYELRRSGEPVVPCTRSPSWNRRARAADPVRRRRSFVTSSSPPFRGIGRAFFAQELPALQEWSFTQEDASRIT
jgi:hypothetical protein